MWASWLEKTLSRRHVAEERPERTHVVWQTADEAVPAIVASPANPGTIACRDGTLMCEGCF